MELEDELTATLGADRYERRSRDIDAAIGRPFLNGVGTRKLKGVANELWGKDNRRIYQRSLFGSYFGFELPITKTKLYLEY